MINTKWIRVGGVAIAFTMAAVLFVEAREIGRVNTMPHLVHQIEHFLYYGFMALLLAHGLGRRRYWLAMLVTPLVGALDEWHQFYVPGRGSSAWDWLTDLMGTTVAVYLYYRWSRSRDAEG